MEEAGDEPLFCERAAGIDIGKLLVSVTIRVPSDTRKGGRQQETREFGTTRRQLLEMADWLRCWGVTRAGMEATQRLLEAGLLPAGTAGAGPPLPGVAGQGAARAAEERQAELGLAGQGHRARVAGGSFVPPDDIRRLRTHTRYRRKLTQARTAEKQRAEKLLEDAHLKLSGVISDVHGVSGRAMLEAVIAGERNPRTLAALARGVLRRKLALLEEALDCSFFTPEHAFVLRMMLGNIDHYTAQIAVLMSGSPSCASRTSGRSPSSTPSPASA